MTDTPNPIDQATLVENAAQAAHEANRAYCRSIGDNSQAPWADAPDWQKERARAGARAILADPTTTPEQSHKGWVALKAWDGWTYGETKDADKKTHPCMVPYDQLPPAQREKDAVFGRTVREVLGLPQLAASGAVTAEQAPDQNGGDHGPQSEATEGAIVQPVEAIAGDDVQVAHDQNEVADEEPHGEESTPEAAVKSEASVEGGVATIDSGAAFVATALTSTPIAVAVADMNAQADEAKPTDPHALPDAPAENEGDETLRGVEDGRPDEPDLDHETAAKVGHAAAQEFAMDHGLEPFDPWDEQPEAFKEQARAHVREIVAGSVAESDHAGWPAFVAAVRTVLGIEAPTAPKPEGGKYNLSIRGLDYREQNAIVKRLRELNWTYVEKDNGHTLLVTVPKGREPLPGMTLAQSY